MAVGYYAKKHLYNIDILAHSTVFVEYLVRSQLQGATSKNFLLMGAFYRVLARSQDLGFYNAKKCR